MKKLFLATVLSWTTFSTLSAQACYVEVNGRPLTPILIANGFAALANEGDGKTALVTCGQFDGIVEGIDRTVKLEAGMCTIISNENSMSVFKCE